MKPEAQRIAIAEACGWTNVRVEGQGIGAFPFGNIPKVEGQDWTSTRHLIPSYLTDLNAMHEAESRMASPEDRGAYRRALVVITGEAWVWHATAAQRAEAFLKTLNLWTE